MKSTPIHSLICPGMAAILFLTVPNALQSSQKTRVDPSTPIYEFEVSRDWLVMKDGVRLSVTCFKPVVKQEGEKFPVLFEFLPYRKDDLFYMRDYPLSSYFARRGYAITKVDIRGTGSSEGKVPGREYSEEELEDAVEIILCNDHKALSGQRSHPA